MAEPRSKRALRRSACVGLAALVATLVWAPGAAVATVRPLSPAQSGKGVAVLHSGVVWVDEGRVLFRGFWSGTSTLGGIRDAEPQIASSETAVALLPAAEGFSGGVPPHRLVPIGQIYRGVPGGECGAWIPQVASQSDFVVVGHELVVAGECQGEGDQLLEREASNRQPLFAHGVSGGRWRVLRWLKGHEPPILASEGDQLAVGVQSDSSATMRVLILDMAAGRLVARFPAPDGYLQFASPRRLLVSVPQSCQIRAEPSKRSLRQCVTYRRTLYSLRGRRVAGLGRGFEPVWLSAMHFLSAEEAEPFAGDGLGGQSVLALGALLDGSSRKLIGFREPARSLLSVAFRWPAVAIVQTESEPRAQSEVTCTSGLYHPSGAPSLRVFDLARRQPFIPPPPPPGVSRPLTCPRLVPPKF